MSHAGKRLRVVCMRLSEPVLLAKFKVWEYFHAARHWGTWLIWCDGIWQGGKDGEGEIGLKSEREMEAEGEQMKGWDVMREIKGEKKKRRRREDEV